MKKNTRLNKINNGRRLLSKKPEKLLLFIIFPRGNTANVSDIIDFKIGALSKYILFSSSRQATINHYFLAGPF